MADSGQQIASRSLVWSRWAPVALAVLLATVAFDQAHKFWMLEVYGIEDKGRVEVTPFLDLVFVKNTGVSYSLFNQDSPQGQYLLAGFAVVASAAMWLWLNWSKGNRLMAISLGLIIGGAIGNGIDRLRIGGVADFISLHAFGFYWYVFNVADVAIVAGVIGLLYESWRGESH